MPLQVSDAASYPRLDRRLRLGFVGGGRGGLVGDWHATGARLSDCWEIVAGALSSNPENARQSGRDWRLAEDRIFTDYREMAEKEAARADGIDAVAICTPNHTHYDIARAFIDAGIDIICDKPVTLTSVEALDLVARQKGTGLVFGVTHPYAYHPMVRQARTMVRRGDLGPVRQVQVEYAQDWRTGPPDPAFKGAVWRSDPKKVGRASTAGDIGTHAYHLLHFVTGLPVSELRADFHICGAPKDMEDTAFINLKFENGAPGAMWLTQAAPGNYCGLRLRIYGEKAGLEWEQEAPEILRFNPLDEPQRIIVRGHGSGVEPEAERMLRQPRGHGEALSDAWANLYRELAIAIAARRDGLNLPDDLLAIPDAMDGARGVKFIEAAADSHEAGGVWTKCWLDG